MATRHLKPEWLHKKFEASRASLRLHCAYLPNALPHVLKALRKGHSFGFVLDQYAHPPNGVPVPFFGITVDTLGALGTFSARYGSAIIPVKASRDEQGVVHVQFEPKLELGDDLKDPIKSTSILARHVESWIRANPAQWLWAHRRFKNVQWPEETP
jgi:KDO2-lipid IV(A) lauroyltransferase